jgi:mannose-6-phosphate isomerase-like protein (cupin superfamily)
MKRTSVRYLRGFRVLVGDEHSQAASMVLMPGGHEGGADNLHRGADQWLYVESGVGEATINGHAYQLKRGTLLLIQRGDKHEISNVGKRPLKTLNFYVPPAYRPDGQELARGKA